MKIKKNTTVICLILLFAVNSQAVRVKPLNLEEMTGAAALIFEGECIRKDTEYNKRLGREEYAFTFRVDRVLKGEPGDTHTVRVLKVLADQNQITSFEKGEKLILFLLGESRLGFSSPAGLGQGRFSIIENADGKKEVVNQYQNRGLLKGLKNSSQFRSLKADAAASINEKGPADYDAFISLTESFIQD